MMTVEQVREEMKDRNITKVSELSGVSMGKIYRLMAGTGTPSYLTVFKLSEYLSKGGAANDNQ